MSQSNNKRQTRVAEIYLRDDGIVSVKIVAERAHLRLADATEIATITDHMANDQPALVLAEISNVIFIERSARVFASSPGNPDRSRAAALIVKTPVSRVLGNFFLAINKPTFPVRLFSDKEEALQWLREFVDSTD